MFTLVQFSIKFSHLEPNFNFNFFHNGVYKTQPTSSFSHFYPNFTSFHLGSFKLRAYRERGSFLESTVFKNGVLFEEKKRVVLVKNNQRFGFNNGGGGGGGGTARILGNLALAIGLTYLSMTGQLGWILDAIVSIWIPIVGLGAFLWWAGRDIMKGTCPNCGNDFQVFKSTLNEELQLCPFCGQPFSVDGNEFVKESVNFSKQSTTFGQAFDNFSRSRNDEDSGRAIDVEAEVKDAD
ncbi:unnamed protein product [Vicia faba]|uniref:Uncharacterized protein n=1 Tax=Vicia faba TaxID=3906 RepID=A0AAV0Z6P7_VICFA|nr:unnamed protein product [Vicia faba]